MPILTNEARTAVLARAGLVPGQDGYDLDELERCATARGWGCSTWPTTTAYGRPGKWRASVMAPAGRRQRRDGSLLAARAVGRSEAEALARALATALAREE